MALNPDSLDVLDTCLVEPSLAEWSEGAPLQFERQGYFAIDPG